MEVNARNIAQAMAKLEDLQRNQCIDAFDPSSRPTPVQEAVFEDAAKITFRAVVAGNQSGKSSIGAREVSWIFQNAHPHWDLKEHFGDKPLLILVIGRTGEQNESELWARKIRPFLAEGSYREVRTGNALQRVVHRTNGNTIIFLSHHNINEAREKVQSFTASFVWLDEAVNSVSFLSELILRIQASRGKMLATFTPLVRNEDVKKMIESFTAPTGKIYQFGMLDNPLYKGREEEILAQFQGLPEAEKNARLYGHWMKADGQFVYDFSPEKDVRDPDNYHPSWPHIEVIDPAASGKAGFLLLANQPGTPHWFAVKSKYLQGTAPSDLVQEAQRETAGYNITRRISDPHEVWFIKEAAKSKIYYTGVYKKNDRKSELIVNSKEALHKQRVVVTSWVPELIEELGTCMWDPVKPDKIVGASRYHLLDCLQYGVDNLPPAKQAIEMLTWDQELKRANNKRKEKEVARAKLGRMSLKRKRQWTR